MNDKQNQLNEFIKQREELDKIIKELSEEIAANSQGDTNIPLSSNFICLYSQYNLCFMAQEPSTLLNNKLFINKKCNQLSTNLEHTSKLLQDIIPKLDDHLFVEMLLCKLLDQGKVLVNAHIDSYKPISYIMAGIYKTENGKNILETFIRLMIRKNVSQDEIGGIYALYFGTLVFLDDYEKAWYFLASILNVRPNNKTGKVLEIYFFICSEMLGRYSKKRLRKILKYLTEFYFKMLCNVAIETRIRSYIDKIIN